MAFLTECVFRPDAAPEVEVHLRRISLGQRLRFLANNFEQLQRLKLAQANANNGQSCANDLAELELNVGKQILAATVLEVVGLGEEVVDWPSWLLEDAPSALGLEVLRRAGEEIFLGEDKRKKS
ncbi:MAG: hypothetical protein OHK0021_17910 [Bryobacter sp.]